MGSKPSTPKAFTFAFILFLIGFSLFTIHYLKLLHNEFQNAIPSNPTSNPNNWLDIIVQKLGDNNINIGLVNVDETTMTTTMMMEEVRKNGKMVEVEFDRVDERVQWSDLFPHWIRENGSSTKCPDVPLPEFEKYQDLDVVVARVPCGMRDVFRLQVNLVVANLLVRSGRLINRGVFAVFVGSCGGMWEIFRCDDVLFHVGDVKVYKPDLTRIRQKMLMPVGTCKLSPPFPQSAGEEVWRNMKKQKEAYVTVLHSSDDYVCGAIALAQSIIKSNTTKDLLLLADQHLSPKSLHGLRRAGWKVRRTRRVRSPFSLKNSYNEWNYSKLQLWKLIDYDKLIFIDSDFIVLRNLDHLFMYPEMSAAGDHGHFFNSGLMVLEPSTCTYETLMKKRWTVGSYNGGDQGFLNEMFTWWHRLPRKANSFKYYESSERGVPDDVYALHYFGYKPWMCYRDYDCNWDKGDHQVFASEYANERWWRVYDAMDEELREFCSLTPQMDARIWNNRDEAKNDVTFVDQHWKIQIKDPRQII